MPRQCVLLGAGEIADYTAVAGQIAPHAFIVCADGGLNHCARLHLTPDLLVGDFDSLKEPPTGIEQIFLSADKNYTDSWHAAEEAFARGYRQFLLLGMLGNRLDHTLGNLGLLAHLAEQGAYTLLTDGMTEARALIGNGSLQLPYRPDCYFSLFALAPCEAVTITGGKYPLCNYNLSALDQRAISNEFASDVVITQQCGVLIALSLPKNVSPVL